MKQLFLDSANLDDIARLVRTNAISGVTTNPTLMATSNKDIVQIELKSAWKRYLDAVTKICLTIQNNTKVAKHLSVEVISSNPDAIYAEARELYDMIFHSSLVPCVNPFIKIPMKLENLEVITSLTNDAHPVKVNVTACMNDLQAKMAADAGADVVSFFYNRIKDGGEVPSTAMGNFGALFGEHDFKPLIICGSIRKPEDVRDAWLSGADVVTASAKVIEQMTTHHQTTKAINQFEEDIQKWLGL